MKYIIVIDKQSRSNPSVEAREYVFEIDELLRKGNISDDLIVERGKAKHIKKVGLTEYGETYLLDKEEVTELGDYVLKLFEGDNYIYVKDEYNNILKAEYVIKNQFTDLYVTDLQMKSAIEESADQITLSVEKVLTGYSTTEETKAMIKLLSDEISLEVSKKVDEETVTGAYLILKINNNKSEAKIKADVIELSANDIFNIIAGNAINLTSKNLVIVSDNYTVDKNGRVTIISRKDEAEQEESNLTVKTSDNRFSNKIYPSELILKDNNTGDTVYISSFPYISIYNSSYKVQAMISGTGVSVQNTINKKESFMSEEEIKLSQQGYTNSTSITKDKIITPLLTQTSTEKIKKNIQEIGSVLELIKNSKIYEYNLKDETDTDKKHIGFVIGSNYKTPEQVMSSDKKAIETYSMESILWKFAQELNERVERVEEQING